MAHLAAVTPANMKRPTLAAAGVPRLLDNGMPETYRPSHTEGVVNAAVNFPTGGKPTEWTKDEVETEEMKAEVAYAEAPWKDSLDLAYSKYNPNPMSGQVGFHKLAPNNYPFFTEDEKYVPIIQADGGVLSDWNPMYDPTPEQADKDRRIAYETGVPHGYVPESEKYKGHSTIRLLVRSQLHTDDEYGMDKDPKTGKYSGGPFWVEVSPKMRVDDLRSVIKDACGIMPGIMRLSYAGKDFEDSQRTLEHYGVAYWNKKFPAWPITIRRI